MSDTVITIVSRLAPDAVSADYYTDDMDILKGKNTNDAPLKYLLNCIYKQPPYSDCSVIAITTPEAETAFAELEITLRGHCEEKGFPVPKIEKISFDGGNNFAPVIAEIMRKIKNDGSIYIDTTGGFRTSAYLLLIVARFIGYSGIKLKKAVYSFFDKSKREKNRIIDITETYNLFDLINAANSFTSFGNSDELARFFAEPENKEIKDIIKIMNDFSDEVALCRTSKLDDLLDKLNSGLDMLSSLETSLESELLFKSLSEVIRKKFGAEPGKNIEYPDVVRWCLDNKMIQQAVTVYAEKMPEYLFKKGIIIYNADNVDRLDFKTYFDDNYNYFYNGFLRLATDTTYSPYPLGNLLYRFFRNGIKDVFKSSIKIKDKDEKNGYENLCKVKNALYDNYGRSLKKYSVSQSEELRRLDEAGFFKKRIPDDTKKFVSVIMKNNRYLKAIQGNFKPYYPKVWGSADLNVIEHLEKTLEENECKFTVTIPTDDMKNILRDIIYVKRFIRNSLNHASEQSTMVYEYKIYFKELGYNVDSELTVDEIETLIGNALERLKTI